MNNFNQLYRKRKNNGRKYISKKLNLGVIEMDQLILEKSGDNIVDILLWMEKNIS